MIKQSMSENDNRKNNKQPIVWPQYWNKRINEEIQMHVDKINNLLVIYESNLIDEFQQERNIGKNFI